MTNIEEAVDTVASVTSRGIHPGIETDARAPDPPLPALTMAEGADVPVAVRIWNRMRSEPSLLFTLAYLFVSFLGLWSNFWFYRGFHLPILEYLQASGYLVAGLRDPAYAATLLATLVIIALVSGPDLYRRRHPERVAAWRRKWWARVLFPSHNWLRWKGVGLSPETGPRARSVLGNIVVTLGYVQHKGDLIRRGRGGNPVHVTMAGDRKPLPQSARLLGSSSTFVFLWWPASRTAEAVPIESIAKLQSLPLRVASVRRPSAAPAAKRVPQRR